MGPLLSFALRWLGVAVSWEAPEACPSEAVVVARVEHFLEGSQAPATDVRARVQVQQVAAEWVATVELTVDGQTEQRELRDPACDVVATATAFVIAIAVDPELPLSELPEPQPPEPAPDPPAPEPEAPPPPDDPIAPKPATETTQPRRRLQGLVRVGGVIDVGSLARTSAGPRLTGGLVWGPWRAEIPLAFIPTGRVPTGSGAVETSLWVAGLRGCRALGWSSLEVPLCAGVEGGQMFVRGRGFDDTATARAVWLAPTFDGALAWEFRQSFWLHVGAGLTIPTHRPRFEVEGFGLAHRAGPVAFRGELGFEVRFP